MGISILIAISICIVVLAIWIPDRNRVARGLRSLSAKQRDLESTLNGFMEEFEKISLQFSRLASTKPASEEQESPDLLHHRANAVKSPAAASHGKPMDKKRKVLELAQKGRSVPEIARRLTMPGGEVALILNLSQEKERAAAALAECVTR